MPSEARVKGREGEKKGGGGKEKTVSECRHLTGSRNWRYLAEAVPGATKYGGGENNFLKVEDIKVKGDIAIDLAEAVRHSITKKTWASYKTAERMLARFMKDNGVKMELPVEEGTMLGFIHWLAYVKKNSAATIKGYLAGIRKLHIIKGIEEPKLRTEMVNMILEGRKNIEAGERLRGCRPQERQPVTPDILALIKIRLREWDAQTVDKLTVWVVCTLLFHGGFRGGELLAKSASCFDPAFTLLRGDLCLVPGRREEETESLQVRVKAPKEAKDVRAVIVDVFRTDTKLCPVRAFKKWEKITAGWEADQPAFRMGSGTPLTGPALNRILKERLAGVLDDRRILTHSFRSGAASMMGSLGCSDNDIKAVGRWGSKAFEDYVKTPRSKRIAVAKKWARMCKQV